MNVVVGPNPVQTTLTVLVNACTPVLTSNIGAEPLTDAVSRLIIEGSIVPRFRANDFTGGIDYFGARRVAREIERSDDAVLNKHVLRSVDPAARHDQTPAPN